MWLLDANTLSLRQTADRDLEIQPGASAPRYTYGILSHRWEDDGEEPTFEEFRDGQLSSSKIGVGKIDECCRVAQSHNLGLVWADTCCIDKRSSAELQEAINSMFRYYERAAVCIVYLRDVDINHYHQSFVKSDWFTRGWTLQELLAPRNIEFYDRNWRLLGDKSSLSELISTATAIGRDVLLGERQLRECSVAERLSWAARRQTTRVEDRAYSLLGIFDVNMTMLYGEGPKSFLRLQEEILKAWDDRSMFAWEGLCPGYPGILASSPDVFAASRDVWNCRDRSPRLPYTVNARGVHGSVELIPYTLDTYLMLLPYTRRHSCGHDEEVGIFLRRGYENNQFLRVSVRGRDIMWNASSWCADHSRKSLVDSINIRQNPLLPDEMEEVYMERIQGFRLNEGLLKRGSNFKALLEVHGKWDPESRIFFLPDGSQIIHPVGGVDIGAQGFEIAAIRFGFNRDYEPVIYFTDDGVKYRARMERDGGFREDFYRSIREDFYRSKVSGGIDTFRDAYPTTGDWSRYEPSVDSEGQPFAQVSSNVRGFWPLKGDRLDGLEAYLLAETRVVGQVKLNRIVVDNHLVWDLHVDELSPRIEAEETSVEDVM